MTAATDETGAVTLIDPFEVERCIRLLEEGGSYRVLRRIERRAIRSLLPASTVRRRAVFVDVETTGLDTARDEIIELGMLSFEYALDGSVCAPGDVFQGFNDPGRPVPESITALTGIDDAMVAGQRLDPEAIASFVAGADLIVAHNADFDRKFCERLHPVFRHKPWACSYREVDWMGEGFDSSKLGHIALGHRLFFNGHRATDDCHAAVDLLSRPLPRSGRTAMTVLLESARRPSWRIAVVGAPFAAREILKQRGYRWSEYGEGEPRCWTTVLRDMAAFDSERQFLRAEVYQGGVDRTLTGQFSAFDRYSVRCR